MVVDELSLGENSERRWSRKELGLKQQKEEENKKKDAQILLIH